MSYCRCENTLEDLRDVLDAFYDKDVDNSKYEKNAAYELVQLCVEIADEFGSLDYDELVRKVCVDEDYDDDDY